MLRFFFWSTLWLGVSGSGLDQSLTSKKTDAGQETVKRDVETAVAAVEEVKEKVKSAAAAVVAPITVRSSCIVTVCSWKSQAHILESVKLPKWFTSQNNPYNHDSADKNRYAVSADDVPVWTLHDEPEFCFQIEQEGSKSKYTSYFKNIPANRRYMLLFGSASFPDEDSDDSATEHEDACKGDIGIEYKYLIDLWKTGDDFTKYPVAPRGDAYIDDRPYTHRRSVVNYREGSREFIGEVLYYIYRLKHYRAWWIADATVLEYAADQPDIPLFDILQNKVQDLGASSFWGVMSDADSMDEVRDEQKVRLFGRIAKGGGRGRLASAAAAKTNVVTWRSSIKDKASLETKFPYNAPIFMLPIVACGLFDKTFPQPKNCQGPKAEREG